MPRDDLSVSVPSLLTGGDLEGTGHRTGKVIVTLVTRAEVRVVDVSDAGLWEGEGDQRPARSRASAHCDVGTQSVTSVCAALGRHSDTPQGAAQAYLGFARLIARHLHILAS